VGALSYHSVIFFCASYFVKFLLKIPINNELSVIKHILTGSYILPFNFQIQPESIFVIGERLIARKSFISDSICASKPDLFVALARVNFTHTAVQQYTHA
jgi:energy-coupling factor transporter transmembrane protein EcfT